MGMLITFIMSFMTPYFKLRYDVPKKVILKATLYNGYVDYKNGVVVLKTLEETNIEEDKKDIEKAG